MISKTAVNAFLAEPALALVGASRSGKKFGNTALRELRAQGYRVYPIHPSADVVDDVRCYHDFSELPEKVDALLVVVPPSQAVDVVRHAAAAGIHHVWLQQGSESEEVLHACRLAGIEPIAGECVLMFGHPHGIHKAHAWLWKTLGKIPA